MSVSFTPKLTDWRAENSNNNHEMDMMYNDERRDRLHDVLLQKHEREWVNWIKSEQKYQADIVHDSCPNNDADYTLTETQDHRGKVVCESISEAGEDSKNNKTQSRAPSLHTTN